jgi:hypothetical protein
VDREICALLLGGAAVDVAEADRPGLEDRPGSAFRLLPGAWWAMLRRMLTTGRGLLHPAESLELSSAGGEGLRRLTWDGDEPWLLWLVGQSVGQGLSLMLELRRGERKMAIGEPDLILGGVDGVVFYHGLAAPFDDRGGRKWVEQFREDMRGAAGGSPAIEVPARDVDRFLDRLYRLPNLPEIEWPVGVGRPEARIAPVPHLELYSPTAHPLLDSAQVRNLLLARMWFAYGDWKVSPGAPGRFVPASPRQAGEEAVQAVADEGGSLAGDGDGDAVAPAPAERGDEQAVPASGPLIRRDLARETEELAVLADLGFRPAVTVGAEAQATAVLPVKLMPTATAELLGRGWRITADQKMIRSPGQPTFSIRSGIDWFELHGGVQYGQGGEPGDGQLVGLPEILAAARAGRSMITLGDGTQGMLPLKWLAEHGLLTAVGQVQGDHLTFKASQAALIDALLNQQDIVDVDRRFAQARELARAEV